MDCVGLPWGRSKNLIVQTWNQHETANSMHINLSKLSFHVFSCGFFRCSTFVDQLWPFTCSWNFCPRAGEIRRNQESISRRKRRLVYHCVSTLGANKSPLFPATCRHGRHGSRTVISNPQDPKHACGRPPLGVSLLSFSPNWGAPENGGIPYTP